LAFYLGKSYPDRRVILTIDMTLPDFIPHLLYTVPADMAGFCEVWDGLRKRFLAGLPPHIVRRGRYVLDARLGFAGWANECLVALPKGATPYQFLLNVVMPNRPGLVYRDLYWDFKRFSKDYHIHKKEREYAIKKQKRLDGDRREAKANERV
jgi:hypothetical protein